MKRTIKSIILKVITILENFHYKKNTEITQLKLTNLLYRQIVTIVIILFNQPLFI